MNITVYISGFLLFQCVGEQTDRIYPLRQKNNIREIKLGLSYFVSIHTFGHKDPQQR